MTDPEAALRENAPTLKELRDFSFGLRAGLDPPDDVRARMAAVFDWLIEAWPLLTPRAWQPMETAVEVLEELVTGAVKLVEGRYDSWFASDPTQPSQALALRCLVRYGVFEALSDDGKNYVTARPLPPAPKERQG